MVSTDGLVVTTLIVTSNAFAALLLWMALKVNLEGVERSGDAKLHAGHNASLSRFAMQERKVDGMAQQLQEKVYRITQQLQDLDEKRRILDRQEERPGQWTPQDIAVGVNAGGDNRAAAVDAIWETHLYQFSPNVLIFGDRRNRSPRFNILIEQWPRKFMCTANSTWGPNRWDDDLEKGARESPGDVLEPACLEARDRRGHYYVLIELHERFPRAKAFMITEADVLLNVDVLISSIRTYAMETNPQFVILARYGVPHIFSRPLLVDFDTPTMLRSLSLSTSPGIKNTACYDLLTRFCPYNLVRTTATFAKCVDEMQAKHGCTAPLAKARPESRML